MKIIEILTERTNLDSNRLTQCLTRFILSDNQRWKGYGADNSNNMFVKGMCGMWAYFAKRVDSSLEVQENDDHVWVMNPATNMLYDAHTPKGVTDKKDLRGFENDTRIGDTQSADAQRFGNDISTGNFQYKVSKEEEQSIIDCYHNKH